MSIGESAKIKATLSVVSAKSDKRNKSAYNGKKKQEK